MVKVLVAFIFNLGQEKIPGKETSVAKLVAPSLYIDFFSVVLTCLFFFEARWQSFTSVTKSPHNIPVTYSKGSD